MLNDLERKVLLICYNYEGWQPAFTVDPGTVYQDWQAGGADPLYSEAAREQAVY